jgi:hypothetical protein
MDGRCGQDAERLITPAWRGSIITVAPHEYMSRARQLDRNYNVIERDAQRVRLRLDYPGAGLADASELMREMHFASILRHGTHAVLGP